MSLGCCPLDDMFPALCTELLMHKLCASVAMRSEEQCMRKACMIIIDFPQEGFDGLCGLGPWPEQRCIDQWPVMTCASGCWSGTMGWRLCLWRPGGRWCCWHKFADSLCLDLHAGGRLIKPKGEGQEVCHHISVQLFSWSWRRFMWPRQIDGAHTEGDIATSVMLSLAHSCRLPDLF